MPNNTTQAPRPWCRETGRMSLPDSYAITDRTSTHSEGQCSNSLLKASLAIASRFFCFGSDTEEVLYQNFKWLIFKETLVNGLLTARQCQWCLRSGASMLLSQRVEVCNFCFRLIQNVLCLPSISALCAGEMGVINAKCWATYFSRNFRQSTHVHWCAGWGGSHDPCRKHYFAPPHPMAYSDLDNVGSRELEMIASYIF